MSRPASSRPPVWRIAAIVPEPAVDAVASAIEGEAETVSCFLADPRDEPGETTPWRLLGHARRPPDRAALAARLELACAAGGFAVPDLEIELLPDTDWLTASLQSFPPIAAGRFHVYGSHIKERPPAGRIPLLVDAGAAFGSGEHASTMGCLLALDALLRRRRFRNVLDLGCGSGILAMAAAKASAVRVLATDVDIDAVRVAAANMRRNGVAGLVRTAVSDGYRSRAIAARAPYDLIFANILARPLVRMAAPLARHLAPGGIAVLSGLLSRQERLVLAAHRSQGIALAGRIAIDGWTTLILRRQSGFDRG